MMETSAKQVKKATVEAVVIRKDGRRENLGVVAIYHRNPLMRAWYWLRGIKGRFRSVGVIDGDSSNPQG